MALARAALDGEAAPVIWPTVVAAGWAGLLSAEAVDGAEQGALEAILVAIECGARLAGTHLVGHLPATVLFELGGSEPVIRAELARGERRAVLATVGPEGLDVAADGEGVRMSGRVADVLDAAGADLIVICEAGGAGRAYWAPADGEEVAVEPAPTYDPTRQLAAVTLTGARFAPLAVTPEQAARALDLQQALLGAEALGAAEACLRMACEHAQSRFAFGRAIGSYQAIKHTLVEMLRRTENARALAYYGGWAWRERPAEFAETALALRVIADQALYLGARENIFIHGAVGATWEYDASLYYRRAELSRRLLGGADGAARRLADILLARGRDALQEAR